MWCQEKNTFKPLSVQSREEMGPRVLITQFKSIPFKNMGENLIGKSNDLYKVKGDWNCYFRAVSFYLSGSEDYHKEIWETICDYINFFPGRLECTNTRQKWTGKQIRIHTLNKHE